MGEFPRTATEVPVLWVTTVPGLDEEDFPFGEVIQMVGVY